MSRVGIAVDGDEVGEQPGSTRRSDRPGAARARRPRSRSQRIGGGHAVVHHQLELARVVAVREHADVAAAEDRDAGVERSLERSRACA